MCYEARSILIKSLFTDGVGRDASFLIMGYDKHFKEEFPVYVFPEQDIEEEVLRLLDGGYEITLMLSLTRSFDEQLNMALVPLNRLISRIEN